MLRIRVTSDEREMLFQMAEATGLSASDIVRQLIRREHAATVAKVPPKRRKR